MMIQFDQLIQLGILMVGVFGVVFPLHLDNRRKANGLRRSVKKMRRAIRIHDARTQEATQRITEIEKLLSDKSNERR